MQNNYSGLINFEVKTASLEIFKIELGVVCSNFLDVVNMVTRWMLERNVGCCNHDAKFGV